MTMRAFAADLQTEAMHRAQFIANILAITGDTRVFWLPSATDTTTSTTVDLNARTITWDATVASRLSALGLGYAQSFNGTTNFGTVPDAANLSFGDGTTDSAFSWLALVNVTDTAATRHLFSKRITSNREYSAGFGTTDNLTMVAVDESAGVGATRTSTSAATMGSWQVFGGVYSAATGGTTAANDMTLYQAGAVKASSATNNASYVAMEDLVAAFNIGAESGGTANFFIGSMAMLLICAGELSASQMWNLKSYANAFFGLSL